MNHEPMFQYILEPGGPAHLRVPHELRTLCGLAPTDEWRTPSTTRPSEAICRECFRRVQNFIVDLMRDGTGP